MTRRGLPLAARLVLWTECDPNSGCHLWFGCTNGKGGYGVINIAGRMVLAHRVAFELAHGRALADGVLVCHSCDTPACINPAHLFEGTPKDNSQDMSAKGRWRNGDPRGERNGRAKLSSADVLAIRRRLASGEGPTAIARSFPVTPGLVQQIKSGRAWPSVQGGFR